MADPRPCPDCGHADDDHRRESWWEEGVEGMTCEECEDAGGLCQQFGWYWSELFEPPTTDAKGRGAVPCP